MKARRLKGNVLGPRASYQPQTESSSEQSVVEAMLKLARDKYFHSQFPANERDQGSDLSGPGDWSGNGQRTTGSPTQYSSPSFNLFSFNDIIPPCQGALLLSNQVSAVVHDLEQKRVDCIRTQEKIKKEKEKKIKTFKVSSVLVCCHHKCPVLSLQNNWRKRGMTLNGRRPR